MADRHSHKCRGCDRVWTHERATDVSEEEYRKLHLCPDCGKEQRTIYFATRAEEERWNRRRLEGLPGFLVKLLMDMVEDEEEEDETVN